MLVKDSLPRELVEAYAKQLRKFSLPAFGSLCIRKHGFHITVDVARSGYVAWPQQCAEANLIAAYAREKCAQLYAQQCWMGSTLSGEQINRSPKYPLVDFAFWVRYGSWSHCSACGSFCFNDQYFRDRVYQDQATSAAPELIAAHRRHLPSDPAAHSYGNVGVDSRWWYLPPMYKPSLTCRACTPAPEEYAPVLLRNSCKRPATYRLRPEPASDLRRSVVRTSQLYRVPRMRQGPCGIWPWARECITWPRYFEGEFVFGGTEGESMLELTRDEQRALQVVCLRTNVQKETYGARHQFNWKKGRPQQGVF